MRKTTFRVLILIGVSLFYLSGCTSDKKQLTTEKSAGVDNTGLPTVNISADQKISSPLSIRVNSQGVWFAHEGELGLVYLFDSKGNQMAKGILKAEGEWMKEGPVFFVSDLIFDTKGFKKGYLEIHKYAIADSDEKMSFKVPVEF
ncbi:MAG: hypothetical protein COB98_04845 [Flavobacteriaceae bacterium]|nr:MAG: hypothetical protein COB98_04845 [Flavobacteriaceae bacterium]